MERKPTAGVYVRGVVALLIGISVALIAIAALAQKTGPSQPARNALKQPALVNVGALSFAANSLSLPEAGGAAEVRAIGRPRMDKLGANQLHSDGRVFLTARDYAIGDYASSVALGDFNGDHKPDLALTNSCPFFPPTICGVNSGGVSILLSKGDGSFQPGKSYSSGGGGANAIVAGDFNRDGKLDLAVANTCFTPTDCSQSGVSVLLGNGDGTFGAAQNYPSGGYLANSVAVGRFNDDGGSAGGEL